MTNATMQKFGWPATKVAELGHWAVMVRPQQCTLGSLVLACKEDATAFGKISDGAHAELGTAVAAIEKMLAAAIGYDKINYLMLMMVDPHVHFHVIPRYAGTRRHGGLEVADAGWPGQPRLDQFAAPDATQLQALADHLHGHWPLGL